MGRAALAFACVAAITLYVSPPGVDSHGAMITPSSRNAVDKGLPFANTQDYNCNCGCCREGCGASKTCDVTSCEAPGARANMSGQPCLWFSRESSRPASQPTSASSKLKLPAANSIQMAGFLVHFR